MDLHVHVIYVNNVSNIEKWWIHNEGCSLIFVIDSFSPKPASVTEQKNLVIMNRFIAILKSLDASLQTECLKWAS